MGDDANTYVLYHHIYSVRSLMVRYAFAIAGEVDPVSSGIKIREESIDIFHDEQLNEHFLLDINPKGQVCWLSESLFSKSGCLPKIDQFNRYLFWFRRPRENLYQTLSQLPNILESATQFCIPRSIAKKSNA